MLLQAIISSYSLDTLIMYFPWLNYRKAFGTSPKGAGKTEVFSGKNKFTINLK
jgi:hypothetical protein